MHLLFVFLCGFAGAPIRYAAKNKYLKIGIVEVPTESSTPGHPKLRLIVPICSFRTDKYVFINCILIVNCYVSRWYTNPENVQRRHNKSEIT
jgi:hypothetical protein